MQTSSVARRSARSVPGLPAAVRLATSGELRPAARVKQSSVETLAPVSVECAGGVEEALGPVEELLELLDVAWPKQRCADPGPRQREGDRGAGQLLPAAVKRRAEGVGGCS